MPGRILIVDDVATNRILLKARLAAAAHEIDLCASAVEALASARTRWPDLVLIGEDLPNGDAFALGRSLRAMSGGAPVALVLLGAPAVRETRLAALDAGIDAVLTRPPPVDTLLAWVRNLLRRCAAEKDLMRSQGAADHFGFAESSPSGFARPGQITLIAPSIAAGMRWRKALRPLMRDQIEVLDPTRALSELNGTGQPDAIVIAAGANQGGGALRLLSDLRSRNETHRAAIVLVQDRPEPDQGIMALDLGVSDLVETGFDPLEMALRLRRELARKALADRCRRVLQEGLRMAATDPLTGLYNRRFALSELDRILSDSDGAGAGCAVMMLDLDRFKRINDRLGHAAGDAVLAEVSRRMGPCLRDGDFLARIGGEEFLAVIRNCDPTAAARAAERLRTVVSASPVTLEDGRNVSVTLSIGMALSSPSGSQRPCSRTQLMGLADQALYAAKAEGRNQVTVHETAA